MGACTNKGFLVCLIQNAKGHERSRPCRKYVTPKLRVAGWDEDQIREQVTIRDGRIVADLDNLLPIGDFRPEIANALPTLCSSGWPQSAAVDELSHEVEFHEISSSRARENV
jgi:hypothetical protein